MFTDILKQIYFGNTLQAYLVSLGTILIGSILVHIFKKVIFHRLKEGAKKTKNTFDDLLFDKFESAIFVLAILGIIYFALLGLTLNAKVQRLFNVASLSLISIIAIRFVSSLLRHFLESYCLKDDGDPARVTSVRGLSTMLNVVIWGIGLVFLLDNLGFKVSAVLAGLGVGGIAVALAAQALLGDIFSYIAIFFDRPFEIGDFIIVGEYLGTVEHIGIKTTRIRSLSGEQLVFSNSDLTNSRVRNYKRMELRRVVFKLGATYDTSLEKVKLIPPMLKNIVEKVENTRFDRAHFFEFADFSLVFEVVYYVLSNDYNVYMDIQQEINFAIKEQFEANKIEFAFPTQTVHLQKLE